MSAAAAMSQPPVIPPRPSRSQGRTSPPGDQPKIPPRPAKRFDRSISPGQGRFAPSPLNDSPFPPKSPRVTRFSGDTLAAEQPSEPIQRPGSVNLPSLGEEGNEYAAINDELAAQAPKSPTPSSPEQTRSVAQDLQLHAPKPSFPAHTAKQRVQAVTRTDSDKAASFGIGRPSSEELPYRGYINKKKSSVGQMSESESALEDDEQGIPEIGQRVPMNPHLGDVQAPSPGPPSSSADGPRSHTPRHHRKHSSRGFSDLPPGSYGLHGHSTPQPTDKLEKAWYDKHPDSFKRESAVSLHDRQNDYAMSSQELNKLVRDTRDSTQGTTEAFAGTPSEEIGYQASDEYTQRFASRPGSAQPRSPELRRVDSPRRDSPVYTSGSPTQYDDDVIHVDSSHNRSSSFLNHQDEEHAADDENAYHAPILASDEVAKNTSHWDQQPAVPLERRRTSFDEESSSRPTSRPVSIHHNSSQWELNSTPLEDVDEYEPLFPEDEENKKKKEEEAANTWTPRHKFPSKDIWEDAPDSVNATAVVSTPEITEEAESRRREEEARAETPAQAFARRQEALAEKESRESENFLRKSNTPIQHPHLQQAKMEARPNAPNRFPSRDVWEDTPESLMHQTTVGTPEPPQEAEEAPRPPVPARPQKKLSGDKPAIPERPRPKQTPSDERTKPVISDKPKPQIPVRPTKTLPSGVDSKEQDAAPRQKPAVPARPVGSKIQALQAGFMSDLNKRLQLGPQMPTKKEEPPAADMVEEKEKAPLVDARKGRARGPQRRAPAAKSAPPVAAAKSPGPTLSLSFSPLRACWSIGDDGVLEVDNKSEKPEVKEKPVEADTKPEPESVPESAPAPESVPEASVELPSAELTSAEPTSVEPASTEPAQIVDQAEKQPDPEVTQPEAVALATEERPLEKLEPDVEQQHPEVKPTMEVEEPTSAPSEDAVGEKPQEEIKTLASNMAGEPVVEAKLEEKDEVEPVAVKE